MQEPVDMVKVQKLTSRIVKVMRTYSSMEIMTVLINLTGQMLAQITGGTPSGIQNEGNNVAEAIKKAAIAKIIHDDNAKRAKEKMN